MRSLACVILAAGEGSRMNSKIPKPLHEVAGRPLIAHVLDTAAALHPDRCVTVLGVGREQVQEHLPEAVDIAVQEEQLGTGHAVMAALPALEGFQGDVLVMLVDAPLIRPETLPQLLKRHRER